jgi:integrase
MKELRDVYHMRFRANHLTKFFGKDYAVEAITEAALARYVSSRRKQGIKLSTVNRELSLLRSALRLAKKRKLIKDMPEIDHFQEHNVRMIFFEHEVYEAIRSHISEVLQDMMHFAYLTGWRKGQLARLEWRDVQDGVIRLSGKTVKHKDVQVLSLAGELSEIIERRRAVQKGPFVFHRNGHPVRDFRAAWKRALAKAGVSGYTFHDFRRTATRNMALAGVPDKHIMQVTGHKTTAMLTRYNITVEQDTHKTLVRTQEFLRRAQSSHIGEIGENPEMQGANTSP